MDIRFLQFVRDRFVSERQPRPHEQAAFQLIKDAAEKATFLADGYFPNRIYIFNNRQPRKRLGSVFYDGRFGGIIWISDWYLERMHIFSLDEVVATFLHENGHHLERKYPEYFDRQLEYDPAWKQLLMYYPSIQKKPWRLLAEIKADIYAVRIIGRKCYLQSLRKDFEYAFGPIAQKGFTNLHFSQESSTHPSMSLRFDLVDEYCRHLVNGDRSNPMRKPFQVERHDKAYKTDKSVTEEETKFNGQRAYYRYVTQCYTGYDFLQHLLSVHQQVETRRPGWGIPSQIREDKKQQFTRDVMMLMVQLLGSANLYVDQKGIFRDDDLPYGAVRAYRASLTRTALHSKGRIQRIKNELRRIGLHDGEWIYFSQTLDKLHHDIQFPFFPPQETTRSAADAHNLKLDYSTLTL